MSVGVHVYLLSISLFDTVDLVTVSMLEYYTSTHILMLRNIECVCVQNERHLGRIIQKLWCYNKTVERRFVGGKWRQYQ